MPFMPVRNLDVGVLHNLKVYKKEKGMSDDAAEIWAQAHFAEGLERMQSIFRLPDNARSSEEGTKAAFQALKAWAQSTP